MDTEYHINKSYIGAPRPLGSIELVQIGRLFFRGAGEVREHLHRRWFELTVITHGVGEVTAGGVAVPVREGDVFLSLPAELHGIRSSAEAPMRYDFFSFYTEDADLSAELERLLRDGGTPEARRFRDGGIRPLIGGMLDALEDSEGLFSERLLALLAEETVIRTCRALAKTPPPAPGVDRLCFRMMQYIDAHVFTLHGTQELAEVFGYNYSYLSSLFKRTTGGTLSDYHREARWRVARLLLKEGKATVTEIAEMVGYSSVYVFSRAYRERFGRPPSRDRGE